MNDDNDNEETKGKSFISELCFYGMIGGAVMVIGMECIARLNNFSLLF